MRELFTRKMLKNLTTICLFLALFTHKASAQESYMYVNGSGSFALPFGKDFSNAYSFGAGAQVGGGISVLNTYLTGRVGYMQFFKKPGNKFGNLTYIPFKFGLRHYFVEEYMFVYGDAGFAIINNDGMFASETKFTYGAGAGIKFSEQHIEVELGYQGVNLKKPYVTAGWIELKVGYNLPL